VQQHDRAWSGRGQHALDELVSRDAGILLGANDLCTSSPATMTPTDTFRAQFQQAMATLMAQDRKPYVLVSSIPNIHPLWEVLHGNSVARWVWANFHICQSMLGATRTAAERQQVVDREQAFNQILAEICGAYARCRWDNLAVYHYQFSASQVSTLDYFQPQRPGGPGPGHLGGVLVANQLTPAAVTLAG
jgi:hypothetical protein